MMKSVLTIIQNFCNRSGSITPPSAVVGETDPQTLQLLHCLYAACETLRAARCWTVQKRKYSFNTADGVSQYDLPADFYAPLPMTHWNRTRLQKLVGPISDAEMNLLLYGDSVSGMNFLFRIFGPDTSVNTDAATTGQFQITPTPSAVETLGFEYTTRSMFIPASGVASTATTLYEVASADTDLCIFDYDIVQLGLEAEYLEKNAGNFENARAAFSNRIDRAVSRHKGAYIGSMAGKTEGPLYHTPPGGLSF